MCISTALNAGEVTLEELELRIPTIGATVITTAILEAGRRSLDAGGKTIAFTFDDDGVINGFK